MDHKSSKDDLREQQKRLADIARAYLKMKKVYRYRIRKKDDMDDAEVIQKCHWCYEENQCADDYLSYENMMLKNRLTDYNL